MVDMPKKQKKNKKKKQPNQNHIYLMYPYKQDFTLNNLK